MHAFIWIKAEERSYASDSKEKEETKFNISVDALVTLRKSLERQLSPCCHWKVKNWKQRNNLIPTVFGAISPCICILCKYTRWHQRYLIHFVSLGRMMLSSEAVKFYDSQILSTYAPCRKPDVVISPLQGSTEDFALAGFRKLVH